MPRPTWDEMRFRLREHEAAYRNRTQRRKLDDFARYDVQSGLGGWRYPVIDYAAQTVTAHLHTELWDGMAVASFKVGEDRWCFRLRHREGFVAEWTCRHSHGILTNAVEKAEKMRRQSA